MKNKFNNEFEEIPGLTYQPEQEGSYSDTGHSFVVERILDGHPDYFEAPEAEGADREPRVLIIADSLAHRHLKKYHWYNIFNDLTSSKHASDIYPAREDIYTVQNRLRELGYTVYVWHKQSLVLLEETSILLEYDIQPSDAKTIRNTAKEKNISADRLKIVTCYTWHNLIRTVRQERGKEYYLQEGQLDLRDFFEYAQEDEQKLDNALQMAEWEHVSSIYFDNKYISFDEHKVMILIQKIIEIAPSIKIFFTEERDSSNEEYKTFYQQEIVPRLLIEKTIYSDSNISDDDLKKIVKVAFCELKNREKIEEALHALTKMENLQRLDLGGDLILYSEVLNDFAEHNPQFLASVTTITITHNNDRTVLGRGGFDFLKHAKSLKKLELTIESPSTLFISDDLLFNTITHLKISNAHFLWGMTFVELLAKMGNLKNLSLCGKFQSFDTSRDSSRRVIDLKQFIAEVRARMPENPISLPQLEHFSVSYDDSKLPDPQWDKQRRRAESVMRSEIALYSELSHYILASARQLKSLRLIDITALSAENKNDLHPKEDSKRKNELVGIFSNLLTLSLKNFSCQSESIDFLVRLLASTRQLESLSLGDVTGVDFIQKSTFSLGVELPMLRHFSIDNYCHMENNDGVNFISELLHTSTQLQQLKVPSRFMGLSNLKDSLPVRLLPANVVYPHLIELVLPEAIQADELLSHAEKLEFLTWPNAVVVPVIVENPNAFSKLRYLNAKKIGKDGDLESFKTTIELIFDRAKDLIDFRSDWQSALNILEIYPKEWIDLNHSILRRIFMWWNIKNAIDSLGIGIYTYVICVASNHLLSILKKGLRDPHLIFKTNGYREKLEFHGSVHAGSLEVIIFLLRKWQEEKKKLLAILYKLNKTQFSKILDRIDCSVQIDDLQQIDVNITELLQNPSELAKLYDEIEKVTQEKKSKQTKLAPIPFDYPNFLSNITTLASGSASNGDSYAGSSSTSNYPRNAVSSSDGSLSTEAQKTLQQWAASVPLPEKISPDADTRYEKGKTLSGAQVFFPIQCSATEIEKRDLYLREAIYDQVIEDDNGYVAFVATIPNDLAACNDMIFLGQDTPEAYARYVNKNGKYGLFSYSVLLMPNKPQMLKHFHGDDYPCCIFTEAKVNILRSYSQPDKGYFIQVMGNKSVQCTLKYLLRLSDNFSIAPDYIEGSVSTLPENLQSFNQAIQKFRISHPQDGEGDLGLEITATKREILEAIATQFKGACRHRASAVLYQYRNDRVLQVKMGYSRTHAWIIVDGIIFDLGGYRVEVNTLKNQSGQQQAEEIISAVEKQQEASVQASSASASPSLQEPPKIELIEEKGKEKEEKEQENITDKEKEPDLIISPEKPKTDKKGKSKEVIIDDKNIIDIHAYQAEFSEFFTWLGVEINEDSFDDFIQQCIATGNRKIAITLQDYEALFHFSSLLQVAARDKKQGSFYIDRPAQLKCQRSQLRLDKDEKTLIPTDGPIGPLYDFLQHPETPNPRILIVNFNHFEPHQWVQANTLGENPRKADGIELPNDTVVIILTTEAQLNNDDSFSRRFGRMIHVSCSSEWLANKAKNALNENWECLPLENEGDENQLVIDLYHSMRWRALLLGRVQLDGRHFQFQPGQLVNALKNKPSKRKIELRNPPWHLSEFKHAWRQWRIFNELECYGTPYQTKPQAIEYHYYNGYEWAKLLDTKWQWQHYASLSGFKRDSQTFVVNPSLFSSAQSDYRYHEENASVTMCSGWLNAESKPNHWFGFFDKLETGKPYTLLVTRELSLDRWAELLSVARHRQCKLNILLATGIELPKEFQERISFPDKQKDQQSSPVQFDPKHKVSVIVTENISESVKTIQKDCKSKKIKIDETVIVTGRRSSELLESLKATVHGKELEFSQRVSGVWKALNAGKTVLLRGEFSPELADYLAPLLLLKSYHRQGKRRDISGRLIIVTNDAELFNYFPHRVEHSISSTPKVMPRIAEPRNIEVFSDETFNAFQQSLFEGSSKQQAKVFEKQRKMLFKNATNGKSHVYIEGMTGVGKSTFMKNWEKAGHPVFYSIESYVKWYKQQALKGKGKQKQGPKKYIFLDETNLKKGLEKLEEIQWGYFWHDGEKFDTEDIIFVFAGNSQAYGHGRKLPEWIDNFITFDPLRLEELYHHIIEHHLQKSHLAEDKIREIGLLFLKTYCFAGQHSKASVLITPRELEWMLLLLCALYQNECDIIALADYCAKTVARRVLPEALLKPYFEAENGENHQFDAKVPAQMGDFELQENHYFMYQHLTHALAIWRLKRINPQFRHIPGLNALLSEGESGIGKSALVKQFLLYNGFAEITLADVSDAKDNEDAFIYISANTGIEDAKHYLTMAKTKNIWVIIDEINTFFLPEDFMNEWLMETSSVLVGTQNSIAHAGRKSISNATQRRMIKVMTPDYNERQLRSILTNKKISPDFINKVLSIFMVIREYAIRSNKSPLPTSSVLLEVALKRAGLWQENVLPQPRFVEKPQKLTLSFSPKSTEEPSDKPRKNSVPAILTQLQDHKEDCEQHEHNETVEIPVASCDNFNSVKDDHKKSSSPALTKPSLIKSKKILGIALFTSVEVLILGLELLTLGILAYFGFSTHIGMVTSLAVGGALTAVASMATGACGFFMRKKQHATFVDQGRSECVFTPQGNNAKGSFNFSSVSPKPIETEMSPMKQQLAQNNQNN